MIKLEDLTPSVYYTQSRDFQFIGRLFDIVLNSVKTNADMIYSIPNGDNANKQLLNLLAMTLGFKALHNYDNNQLRAICSALPMIMRYKGSLRGLLIAANTLLKAEGINDTLDYELGSAESEAQGKAKQGCLTLYIPATLSDLTLFRDLLPYLIPAGISCEIVKELKVIYELTTTINLFDKVTIYKNTDFDGYDARLLNEDRLGLLTNLAEENVVDAEGKIAYYNMQLASAGDLPGTLGNTSIYRPVFDKDTTLKGSTIRKDTDTKNETGEITYNTNSPENQLANQQYSGSSGSISNETVNLNAQELFKTFTKEVLNPEDGLTAETILILDDEE